MELKPPKSTALSWQVTLPASEPSSTQWCGPTSSSEMNVFPLLWVLRAVCGLYLQLAAGPRDREYRILLSACQKGCYSCNMTQISSAARFHSHKASSKGSSEVCSSAGCSGSEQAGTWLLCCVTGLSSSSSSGARARASGHQGS